MVGKIKNQKLGQSFSAAKQARKQAGLVREVKATHRGSGGGLSAAKCRIVGVMYVGNMREMEGQLLVFETVRTFPFLVTRLSRRPRVRREPSRSGDPLPMQTRPVTPWICCLIPGSGDRVYSNHPRGCICELMVLHLEVTSVIDDL